MGYVTVSLLTGARTEELRALTWDHVDLDARPDAEPPILPSIKVWRSVRDGGDTKTRKSRRTLGLPVRAVNALRISSGAAGNGPQEGGKHLEGHRDRVRLRRPHRSRRC
jgi:integrase